MSVTTGTSDHLGDLPTAAATFGGASNDSSVPSRTDKLAPGHFRVIIALFMAGAFTVILNETTMSVALPPIMADLGVSAATDQWLTTAFMLAMGVVIPATGFLTNNLGTRGATCWRWPCSLPVPHWRRSRRASRSSSPDAWCRPTPARRLTPRRQITGMAIRRH
ncbi:hypothetical protein ACIO3S_24630 [Nocardioides sp. NPDC087217]|uniref:hypothetical protein n=1 Tax=Nocardioides sp. NPDC087217 TaxID=3364335 RepID=UPI0038188F31